MDLSFEEGIDVLYGTNTFRISLETLEPGLAYYLPAYSLCMVKSLELVLDPRVLGISQPGIRDAVPRATGREERLLEALFRSMEPALLGLQKLYVGFCGGLGFWNHDPYSTPKQRYQNYRAHLLPLVDDAARAFGSRLREIELGLPLSSFWAHFVTGLGAGGKFQAPSWQPGRWPQGGYHARQRIWRSVSSASEGQPAGTEADLGYWITETWSDTPDGWMLDNDRYWE
ncbi:uncharacterized protein E0L32_009227 [Thyridium curvatum]|uniref:Uncharacterized protein n=1 Tax=Thyridium curvatum TaxID=1093900 RepID=A0A507ASE9_9PEZI|nr:uncharacterized protein E0L32_009227 [Thyridium curvatum]TPX09626.1 hypothetical protein E0L32_009227 [Thyridium curvatum]